MVETRVREGGLGRIEGSGAVSQLRQDLVVDLRIPILDLDL